MHSLILQSWKPFFAWLPVETMIHENQQAYYNAINQANLEGEATVFVEFMLTMIKSTLEEIVSGHDINVGINDGINVGINISDKVINLLKDNGTLTQAEIALKLGVSKRQVERIFRELKSDGQIMRCGSNKKGTWIVCENRN